MLTRCTLVSIHVYMPMLYMSSQVFIWETEEYALPTFVLSDWRLLYMFKHILHDTNTTYDCAHLVNDF